MTMNFSESLQYLYSLGNEVLAMKLGLESTEKLLGALGNPQEKFLKVQVAGTNGKGSTCAFLEAICLEAGIKIGTTTSPHLISITERVRIGGAEISEEDFARHAARIRKISEDLVKKGELENVPTFFEQVTAIAISAFAEAKVELAILETGLGGRFDSVTATRAEIAAITPIDYDHQKILGEKIEQIAAEKAAIIRQENTRKVLVAPQRKEAERVILERCREMNIEPVWATTEAFAFENETSRGVVLGLSGKHQFVNAALAVRIAEALRSYGFKITDSSIRNGLKNARHQGRLEFYRGILFDGAHNAAGAVALAEYLDEYVAPQPLTMIFGAMRDKNLQVIAETLFPRAERLIFTKPDNPRSMPTEELLKSVPENFARESIYQSETVAEALEIARKISPPENLICVTGSLYLVGEAQKFLSSNRNI